MCSPNTSTSITVVTCDIESCVYRVLVAHAVLAVSYDGLLSSWVWSLEVLVLEYSS